MNHYCEALQKPKQTTLCRHTERDKREVSKTLESSTPKESMIKQRINKLDSPLQHCDSYNLDSRVLDSSLSTKAQNDESLHPLRHTERSEVSKTLESSTPKESMIKQRINKLDSALKHCDSYNLDSWVLDSSLTSFAQNDKI